MTARSVRKSLGACCLLLALAGGPIRATQTASTAELVVRAYVDAFNARDLDAMLGLADESIEWATVADGKVTVETVGRAALRESMAGYFASCASCRSSLEWVAPAGSRVAALERASWTGKDGAARSQASLSVYELRDGKIARVLYFPAE